ncbi:AAA family ATPase [Candidatus Daviesbacteria bacterium]|nr:AAA family ATPase [Candidatus Daviesbacteria bacterium]
MKIELSTARSESANPILPLPRSLTEARSILSQVVDTQLLPVEWLKTHPRGEVVDLQKAGETIAALEKISDHYEVLLYDGRGNQTRVVIDPTLEEIAGKSRGTHIQTRDSGQEKQYGGFQISEVLKDLGFQANTASKMESSFYSMVPQFLHGGLHETHGMITVTEAKKIYLVLSAGSWQMGVSKVTWGGDTYTTFFFVAEDGKKYAIKPKPTIVKTGLTTTDPDYYNPNLIHISDSIRLRRENTLFRLEDQSGQELVSYSGTNPILDPQNPNFLYFINTGQVYRLDLSGVAGRTSRPVLERQIQVIHPKEMKIDPNGNFLVIRSVESKLVIIEKESGDIIKSFDDCKGPILVDEHGDIVYVDSQNRLREIQTNFQSVAPGGTETAQQKREEELKQMQERFATLELKKVQRQKGGEITETDVANTLRETIARQVNEPLAETNKPEEIEDIMDRLQGLKADPANQAYGEVIDEFIVRAREKLSGIKTGEFNSQLAAYEKSLEEVKSVGDTIGLDEEFARLLELRQKLDITDSATRRNIEQRLRAIQTQKDAIVGQYQQELTDTIQQALPNIEQLIKETGSSQELAMFGATVEAQQFEMMLANIRDPKMRKELRDRLNTVKAEHRSQLDARGKQLEEEQRLRWAQVVEEVKEDLDLLGQQVSELPDVRELDRFRRNPLVTAWRAKIFALPPELRTIEEQKLEIIMGSRKKDIEHRKELGAIGDKGDLKFGNTSFPVYKEPPRIWRPVLLPIKGVMPGYADLAFQDEQGRLWHPDPEHRTVVISDMNDAQTTHMIERYGQEAEAYFRTIKREVPQYNDKWRLADYQMQKLGEVAESMNIQTTDHMGITILEGEAGTGKNVLIDVLANLSNREVITIACNENTAKEDLTYEFYYDPAKGTYKLPSRLVEALKRPGVVILFDEINTVKPGIVKMLNPLFDYRRKLVINEGGVQQEIVADPTVILVGTMNPQDYAGVDKLAETILSRADIIGIDYPPFEEIGAGRTRYRSDEAEMLYSYMHGLEGLKQRELKTAWHYVINKDTTNGGDMLLRANSSLEKDVRRLYDAIRVANRLREMYRSYQVGDSNEPMDFTTSLREMVNIALRMNHAQNVKDVVKRVILPKIGDRRQRVLVGQTIEAVLV